MSLAVLTAAAWTITIYHALHMPDPMDGMSDMAMSGMSASGWSFSNAAVFMVVWSTMMAAMIVVFASAQAGRECPTAVPTWISVS